MKAAELVDALSNAGPFTVFAPTNAAFDKLPAGTVEGLLKPEKKEDLADILQYHVSVGVYKAEQLQEGQTLGQVNGGNITITKKDGKIIVTPHGFLAGKEAAEEKASIENYKKEYADYWKDIIGTDGDFDLKEEKED